MSALPLDGELPLFPLGSVLFPDGLLALRVFEARYLDLMSRCMRESRPFGVVALKSGAEVGAGDPDTTLHGVGTLAELIEVDSAQSGILLVRCRGTHRFTLDATRRQADGLWLARTTEWADEEPVAPDASQSRTVQGLADAIAAMEAQGAQPFLKPHRLDSAGWVADRWAEMLPIAAKSKQLLLELTDPMKRLEIIDSLMRSGQVSH